MKQKAYARQENSTEPLVVMVETFRKSGVEVWGRGDHSMLCQSTYKEVSANGIVSDFKKGCNQNTYFLDAKL